MSDEELKRLAALARKLAVFIERAEEQPETARLTPALRLVAAERYSQIHEKGYTPQHDAALSGNLLQWGAFCFLERAAQDRLTQDDPAIPRVWPWKPAERPWKPKRSQIGNLVVAAAMVVAAIDRLIARGELP
jgi:hypothetical protein